MNERLTLALPKGRVFAESVALLQRTGLNLTFDKEDRALMIDAGDADIIELRNADVPTYVDVGVADAGIVGKDVLLEAGRSIYEPVDLKFSRCHMSLIRPQGDRGKISRVASKFPNIARRYFAELQQPVEVIKLSGNVELACLTGLADAVVDIVQTGRTLKANQLEEVEVLFESSARFVVNRAALKLKTRTLRPLIETLRELVSHSPEG